MTDNAIISADNPIITELRGDLDRQSTEYIEKLESEVLNTNARLQKAATIYKEQKRDNTSIIPSTLKDIEAQGEILSRIRDDLTPENAAAVILFGLSLNMSPPQSLQYIHIVKGKPFISTLYAWAKVMQSGAVGEVDIQYKQFGIKEQATKDMPAVPWTRGELSCTVSWRRILSDEGNSQISKMTEEAVNACPRDITSLKTDDFWYKDTKSALLYYILRRVMRIYFPDISLGINMPEPGNPDELSANMGIDINSTPAANRSLNKLTKAKIS